MRGPERAHPESGSAKAKAPSVAVGYVTRGGDGHGLPEQAPPTPSPPPAPQTSLLAAVVAIAGVQGCRGVPCAVRDAGQKALTGGGRVIPNRTARIRELLPCVPPYALQHILQHVTRGGTVVSAVLMTLDAVGCLFFVFSSFFLFFFSFFFA